MLFCSLLIRNIWLENSEVWWPVVAEVQYKRSRAKKTFENVLERVGRIVSGLTEHDGRVYAVVGWNTHGCFVTFLFKSNVTRNC